MGAERFFTRPIIVVEFGWDLSGKKIIKLKIVHILCELFFYVMTMRFTNWYIYIIWTTTFLCVWWHFDKTVMTSLAVKKVKFKYSLIEICIYDYKCIMINWVKFITRLITFLYLKNQTSAMFIATLFALWTRIYIIQGMSSLSNMKMQY